MHKSVRQKEFGLEYPSSPPYFNDIELLDTLILSDYSKQFHAALTKRGDITGFSFEKYISTIYNTP